MAEIVMPRLSDSMEEGTVLKWMKAVGDDVAVGHYQAACGQDHPGAGILLCLGTAAETLAEQVTVRIIVGAGRLRSHIHGNDALTDVLGDLTHHCRLPLQLHFRFGHVGCAVIVVRGRTQPATAKTDCQHHDGYKRPLQRFRYMERHDAPGPRRSGRCRAAGARRRG